MLFGVGVGALKNLSKGVISKSESAYRYFLSTYRRLVSVAQIFWVQQDQE